MIIEYNAKIKIEIAEKPTTNYQWEQFNISLESIMEKALEENSIINISIAEIIMEEIQND